MRFRGRSDDTLRCSFCQKSQDVVGKLISTPRDYPRAHICDECIAICASILEDDRPDGSELLHPAEPTVRNALLGHPLACDLMTQLEAWVRAESMGRDGIDELQRIRETARQMITGE